MKSKQRFAFLVAFVLVIALALSSCAQVGEWLGSIFPNPSVDESGTCTILVGKEIGSAACYTVKLDKVPDAKNAEDILNYLKENEELHLEISGGFINEVGDLANDYAAGDYIWIWTSNEADQDIGNEWNPADVTYEGKTLVSSKNGIDKMSITDGTVIYFGTMHYGA